MGYIKNAGHGKVNKKGETTGKSDRIKLMESTQSHGHKEVKETSTADRKKALEAHAKEA